MSRPPGRRPSRSRRTGFEDLGPVTLTVISPEGSGGPQDALKALSKSFEEKYPNVTVKISFRDFAAWTKQAKLVASSDNPPDVFGGNQGYQLDGELVKAGLILPLTEYAKAYGWDGVLLAGDAAAVRVDRRRPDVRRGHAVGRRPDRPVRRRVRQQEEARRRRRRPGVAEDVRRLRRRAGQAARLAAGRRAGDHARQPGPVRRAPPLGRDPGRLHAGAGRPRLDLPEATARRSTPRATSRRSRSSRSGRTRATSASPTRTTRATTSDAAIAFGKGEGALLIAGNWNAATAREGLGDDADLLQHAARRERRHGQHRLDELPDAHLRQDEAAGPGGGVPRLDHRAGRRPGARRHPAGAGGDRRAPPSRATRSARRSRTAGTSSSRTAV